MISWRRRGLSTLTRTPRAHRLAVKVAPINQPAGSKFITLTSSYSFFSQAYNLSRVSEWLPEAIPP